MSFFVQVARLDFSASDKIEEKSERSNTQSRKCKMELELQVSLQA
jgi:hypothetical protein